MLPPNNFDKALTLSREILTDPLYLALAWKKAHDYIRSTNWYADNLELDNSSIDLANRCDEWAEEIGAAHERNAAFEFEPLQLVPAPKTQAWEFVEIAESADQGESVVTWRPKRARRQAEDGKAPVASGDEAEIKLRPLAHVDIRDQTIMTLVMMCLANELETNQGDPATDYPEVHKQEVVSYGNRLYCQYVEGKAFHSFGATTTYSKYFADYRKFLERPYYFAGNELAEKADDEEVYLVELDLRKFFDLVNREKLTGYILGLAEYQPGNNIHFDATVERLLEAFKSWRWEKGSEEYFKKTCDSENQQKAPLGLPQGLVASGFLANIYMAKFDAELSAQIGKSLESDSDFRLIDYCRYVDDIRLVLLGPSRKEALKKRPAATENLNFVARVAHELVKQPLNDLDLQLNDDKTKVEVFRGKAAGISRTLEDIQTNISGPVTQEDADRHLGQLESLLALASELDPKNEERISRKNRLAGIEKDILDIREDTLKRFAANKICRLLSAKRHFTARKTSDSGRPLAGEWDYLQERLARRLIACWSRDPALTLLLKKGLELFPSPNVLKPVLDELDSLIAGNSGTPDPQAVKKVALGKYCLSEIFRHAATYIHRKDSQAFPAQADVSGFFEVLQAKAAAILLHAPTSSHEDSAAILDVAAIQGSFLLMVRLDTTLEHVSPNPHYDLIFKLALGYRNIETVLSNAEQPRDFATAILIANQLVEDKLPLRRAVSSFFESVINQNAPEALELVAIHDADLARSLIRYARQIGASWQRQDGIKAISKALYLDSRASAKPLSELTAPIALHKLILRSDNPFASEAMALKLMDALLEKLSETESPVDAQVIDLANTRVQFSHFSIPPTFPAMESNMEIVALEFHRVLGTAAAHFKDSDEHRAKLQCAALCVRAALAGSDDPTGFASGKIPRIGYRGLKSTRFKRQLGMLTTPEALAGESAQFTSWLATLLAKLLRWPGISVNDQGYEWGDCDMVEGVKEQVGKRLKKLMALYCRQSGVPGLPELVSPRWPSGKKELTVSMVQTKVPTGSDFKDYGLLLDEIQFRATHRLHLTRVAALAAKHVEAEHREKPKDGSREQDIDLIVFPELSVNPEDTDVLVQLSQKTHAIVVAGLGFLKSVPTESTRNCALWIVPRKHNGNRNEVHRLQGKHHLTPAERKAGISSWRPYQLIIELKHPDFREKDGFALTAAICFDSTDIALSADLRDKTHALLVPALNKDVGTFDSMVEALHYHMYQHVVLVNSGEYGGSYAMAPYRERHERLIAHSSGADQVSINTFKMNMFDFRRDGLGESMQSGKAKKSVPAGVTLNRAKESANDGPV
jgi:hypothetical protein